MHRILVEETKWIGDNRFVHALNYCMLLPGPEAQQLVVSTFVSAQLSHNLKDICSLGRLAKAEDSGR